MTRTDEYLLPDGSPRFGIRTESTATAKPAKVQHHEAGRAAAQAARMTAAQLRNAVDYRFDLDCFQDDEAMIDALRSSDPNELAEAEGLVVDRLGSPKKWFSESRSRFTGIVVGMGVDPHRQVSVLLGSLGLAIFPFLAMVAAMLLNLPDWAVWAVLFLVPLGLKPARRKVYRKARGTFSTTVGPEDRQMIWDDVVNATLLEVLAAKGVAVDQMTVHTAGRRFNHLRHVAGVTQQLLELPLA